MVGNNKDSESYLKQKEKFLKKRYIIYGKFLDENIEEKIIIELIENLNKDKKVHGIMVELHASKKIK